MPATRLHNATRLTHCACAFIAASGLLASSCGRGAGSTGVSGGGSSGAAGTGGGCVDVSHVDEMQTDSLEVIGRGFETYEGHTIRIVVTQGEPTYGLGEALIQLGSFEILLPGVLGDYTEIGIYADTVRDDACNPADEILWQWTTGPASARGPAFQQGLLDGVVWEVTPDSLRTFEEAGPCNINGNFDLTNPRPCPAED
jgi:hypothetical protein